MSNSNAIQDQAKRRMNAEASWVALNTSNIDAASNATSIDASCHVELERLLHEAQREGSTPASSQNGSYASRDASDEENDNTHVVFQENVISVLPNVNVPPATTSKADMIMSWASGPSNKPPKPGQFQHPMTSRKRTFSLRNTDAMKNGFLSWEFLRVFLPSLLLSNIFTFGIGYYVGKKHGTIAVRTI